jgi:hypothetical protein
MSMARLWRDQGKPQQARELLAPVYGWFTEGFEPEPSSASVIRATSPATSLIRSRNKRVLNALGSPCCFRIAFHRCDLALQLAPFIERDGELPLELADVGTEYVEVPLSRPPAFSMSSRRSLF